MSTNAIYLVLLSIVGVRTDLAASMDADARLGAVLSDTRLR
jgi:hypothetical protein